MTTAASNVERWLEQTAKTRESDWELGLTRVGRVYRSMGSPRPRRALVTVGGTNGKGSTVAALEGLLSLAGVSWASYTSPHLIAINERIKISGEHASDQHLQTALEQVEHHREKQDTKLTYFEFLTLAALLCMRDVDVGILEVGLGGARDATNVADADIAVITTIALDHQKWLGNTVSEIAADKVGIARRGRYLVLADPNHPRSLEQRATKIGAAVRRPQVGSTPNLPVRAG